jgi:hypothetical protein
MQRVAAEAIWARTDHPSGAQVPEIVIKIMEGVDRLGGPPNGTVQSGVWHQIWTNQTELESCGGHYLYLASPVYGQSIAYWQQRFECGPGK